MNSRITHIRSVLEAINRGQKIIREYSSQYGLDGFVVAVEEFLQGAKTAALTSCSILEGERTLDKAVERIEGFNPTIELIARNMTQAAREAVRHREPGEALREE